MDLIKFDLRCVLVYSSGKRWASQWNKSTDKDPTTCAHFQSREGLLFAGIEAKHIHTREVRLVASVKAEQFDCFKWIAMVRMPSSASSTVTLAPTIVGLEICTHDLIHKMFRDGNNKTVKKDNTDGHNND